MSLGDTPDGPDSLTLGGALQAARERAGLSVDQVSATTRIRSAVIRDLEDDRFASSGAPVYARGHIRAIAGAVGADRQDLLDRYDRQTDAVPPGAVPGPPQPAGPELAPSRGSVLGPQSTRARERTGPRWGVAVLAALVLLLVVVFVGARSPGGARHPAQSVDTLRSVTSPHAVTSPSVAPPAPSRATARPPVVQTPDPSAVAVLPPPSGARLRVRAIGGVSWVSIRNSSKATLFEGVLSSGQVKDFTDASALRVTVGNASAIDLNCGGRDSGPVGRAGAVKSLSCTVSGLTAG